MFLDTAPVDVGGLSRKRTLLAFIFILAFGFNLIPLQEKADKHDSHYFNYLEIERALVYVQLAICALTHILTLKPAFTDRDREYRWRCSNAIGNVIAERHRVEINVPLASSLILLFFLLNDMLPLPLNSVVAMMMSR
jgi:hypothetical protein